MTVKLNYATIDAMKNLVNKGFTQDQAETILLEMSKTEHDNIYSKTEIDEMLAETVKNVFTEIRREFDKRMEASEKRLEVTEKRIEDEIKEMRSHKRWIVGTMITVGLAVIGYLQFFH